MSKDTRSTPLINHQNRFFLDAFDKVEKHAKTHSYRITWITGVRLKTIEQWQRGTHVPTSRARAAVWPWIIRQSRGLYVNGIPLIQTLTDWLQVYELEAQIVRDALERDSVVSDILQSGFGEWNNADIEWLRSVGKVEWDVKTPTGRILYGCRYATRSVLEHVATGAVFDICGDCLIRASVSNGIRLLGANR